MKREELATWLTEPNTNKLVSKKWVYDKTEADSVMDFLEYDIRIYQDIVAKAEARINELESKLQMEHRVGEDWCAKYWDLRASQPNWIGVEEKPKKDGWYIVYTKERGEVIRCYHTNGEGWTKPDYDETITHWIPMLPKPTTDKSTEDIKDSLITEQTSEG